MNSAPFCGLHNQHYFPIMPSQKEIRYLLEGKDLGLIDGQFSTILNGQDEELSIISETSISKTSIISQSEYFLSKNYSSWKKYMKNSKADRNWIMQEWMAATKHWRLTILYKSFKFWERCAIIFAQASQFRMSMAAAKIVKCMKSTLKSRHVIGYLLDLENAKCV